MRAIVVFESRLLAAIAEAVHGHRANLAIQRTMDSCEYLTQADGRFWNREKR